MKRAIIVLAIIVNALGTLFLALSYSVANEVADKEIRRNVTSLIDSRNTVRVQDVSIQRDDQGQLNLEINATLGNCSGRPK
jgi:hypothetical protein